MLFWGRKGFTPGRNRIPDPSHFPLLFFNLPTWSCNIVERLCVKNLKIDCWCGHLRGNWECVLSTHPCPPPPVLYASCVHVLVCLCLLYLLVELIIMILIQGKDPPTNWILPIPLNWMIHFSLSQAMIAPKKKILICFAIHLLLLPLPIKRLTQAILLTSVL